MSVFISYFRPDEQKAKNVELLLRASDIQCYLDVLDDRLNQASNVTARIIDALHKSTHLMALISPSTSGSWWVPFEIGVATETGRRITSFVPRTVLLPDFLKVWPVLRSMLDLNHFIARFRSDSTVLRKALETTETRKAAMREAQSFHARLKRDLGQD